ncbi:MAG: hypothetical protein P4N59_17820 [Negativicutes bacterium]|nr:hypothetical protein [Negativicutes bacterium]
MGINGISGPYEPIPGWWKYLKGLNAANLFLWGVGPIPGVLTQTPLDPGTRDPDVPPIGDDGSSSNITGQDGPAYSIGGNGNVIGSNGEYTGLNLGNAADAVLG